MRSHVGQPAGVWNEQLGFEHSKGGGAGIFPQARFLLYHFTRGHRGVLHLNVPGNNRLGHLL